jgi:hypothetical protein
MNLKSSILGAENLDYPAHNKVERINQEEKRVNIKSTKVDTLKKS